MTTRARPSAEQWSGGVQQRARDVHPLPPLRPVITRHPTRTDTAEG